MTETKKFAKDLTEGDTFYANGTWEIVEMIAPVPPSGLWVYTRSGESYYYINYITLRIAE